MDTKINRTFIFVNNETRFGRFITALRATNVVLTTLILYEVYNALKNTKIVVEVDVPLEEKEDEKVEK